MAVGTLAPFVRNIRKKMPGQTVPGRSRDKPGCGKPSQAEPSQSEPPWAKPSQSTLDSGRAELG